MKNACKVLAGKHHSKRLHARGVDWKILKWVLKE
jgi:hypothetical protein